MRWTQRTRKAAAAGAMAVVIGGGGVAVGAATAGADEPARPAAAQSAQAALTGYADVVRKVLPSVVLIRTSGGLGSGVVLDSDGDIITNAHVAGNATSFQVQLADDPQPRQARLVGAYPAGDLAVIRVDDRPSWTGQLTRPGCGLAT